MIAHYLDYIRYEKHYSSLTAMAYGRDLAQFCVFLSVPEAEFSPNAVSEDDIRSWLLSMLDAGESPRSIGRKLSTLKSFWRFCLKTGAAERNVPGSITPPKTSKPLPAFYKDAEMDQALAIQSTADDDDFESVRNALVVEMFYATGLRRAELIGLCDADVDTEGCTLRVLGKRNKQRIVPFGRPLAARIEHYKRVRNANVQLSTNALFVLSSGKPLYAEIVYRIVHNTMEQVSSLHKQSPHVLRHTFATTMLNHGADINAVKELLGHANLAATQIYTHTTFEKIHQVYKQAHPRA